LFAWFTHHGLLSALHLPGEGPLDWIVTGLILATGSEQLTTLQALGGAAHAPVPAQAAGVPGVPEVMHVSGQVRVTK
jgi:hypothetical protein